LVDPRPVGVRNNLPQPCNAPARRSALMGKRGAADGLEQAARAATRRFVDAISGGDPAMAAVGYAEDARLLAPSATVVRGRAEIESFWRAGLEAGIRAVELRSARIDRHGSFAIETGHYSMVLRRPRGDDVVDRGSYLRVHEPAADGGWAWALEAFTPDGHPQVAVPALSGTEGEVGNGS
jgi:ketosteroid isomerase-like protein